MVVQSQRLFWARGRGKLSALRYALFHRWTKLICLINAATKFPLSKLISIYISPSFLLPLLSLSPPLRHISRILIAI